MVLGESPFFVRGVTYGSFRPLADGHRFPNLNIVDEDFRRIVQNGGNAVRTYDLPPQWLLDTAARHGLRILVGLPWEQHVTFLDRRDTIRSIQRRVEAGVRACAGHPAVLGYTVGNEIPASIVRWSGARRIERFLEQLYDIAKSADPQGLVTYVNFPTTEYLNLPFVDFVSFNVFLESRDRLAAYLARLQNLADGKPVVLAEVGLDSRRNGLDGQAVSLDWQVRCAFEAGCAGTFVFSWTDEWNRGGIDVEDWDFGLTTRDREPKLALEAVRRTYEEVPFGSITDWPRVSVVVCSYNGAKTIRQTLAKLQQLDYPDYEVLVVNDGSRDATARIARDLNVRLIELQNGGLSRARNVGLREATGEIVAYIDDDAFPEQNWLRYLAACFRNTDFVGVGGPNLVPAEDGLTAQCVANAPGGPIHVLLSDREAEHIPGCNMAFRRDALEEIGGFDRRFRIAGDDVDLCWRLQERGGKLGFSPAAVVWHHRRNSVRGYLKQQRGYGRAEAQLQSKWPRKYNVAGHPRWAGRIYGAEVTEALLSRRGRIYQGVWGCAPFQSLYHPPPGTLAALSLVPEWYLLLGLLAAMTGLGMVWKPLLWAAAPLLIGAGITTLQALVGAARARLDHLPKRRVVRLRARGLTFFLHLAQPAARLHGRLQGGLHPLRRNGMSGWAMPRPFRLAAWSEDWRPLSAWLQTLEAELSSTRASLIRGGPWDCWDLELRGGLFGAIRIRAALEEHGEGRQLVRFRVTPRCSAGALALGLPALALTTGALVAGSWIVAGVFALSMLGLGAVTAIESGRATATARRSLRSLRATPGERTTHRRRYPLENLDHEPIGSPVSE